MSKWRAIKAHLAVVVALGIVLSSMGTLCVVGFRYREQLNRTCKELQGKVPHG